MKFRYLSNVLSEAVVVLTSDTLLWERVVIQYKDVSSMYSRGTVEFARRVG